MPTLTELARTSSWLTKQASGSPTTLCCEYRVSGLQVFCAGWGPTSVSIGLRNPVSERFDVPLIAA